MLPPAMALRKFNLRDTPPADSPDASATQRMRTKSLIGGSVEMRRLKGKPTDLQGTYILDPIFRPGDLETLRAACSPTDPRPLVIEIGFQLGEFAIAFCQANPGVRYVGFEVRKKFCQESDKLAVEQGVTNALFCLVDAREMLREAVEPGTLDQLLVFFPDPWWKPRHIKKRLLTDDFVAEAARYLRPGGRLLLKTDVPGYADWAQDVMAADPNYDTVRLPDPAAGLPFTLRERRCKFHGYPTFAVQATRRDAPWVQKDEPAIAPQDSLIPADA